MLSKLPFHCWPDFKAFYKRESPEQKSDRLAFDAFTRTCTVTCTSQERADAIVKKFDGFTPGPVPGRCISAALLGTSSRGRPPPQLGGGGYVNEVKLKLSNLPFAEWPDFKAFYFSQCPEPRDGLDFNASTGTCTVTCTSQERADAIVKKFNGFSPSAGLRISAALLAASNRGRAPSQLNAAPSWPQKVYPPEDEHAAIYSPVAARTLDSRFMIELHGLRRDKSAHELFDFLAACFPNFSQNP